MRTAIFGAIPVLFLFNGGQRYGFDATLMQWRVVVKQKK
jgi:hypothetical protein